jgi:hypothetical protein
MELKAAVYLMGCPELKMFKIGYTTQMPGKRLDQISSPAGNPWKKQIKVILISVVFCESEEVAKYLESFMHEVASPWRHENSEWFSCLSRCQSDLFKDRIAGIDWGYKDVLDFSRRHIGDLCSEMKAMSEDAEWIAEMRSVESWRIQSLEEQIMDIGRSYKTGNGLDEAMMYALEMLEAVGE